MLQRVHHNMSRWTIMGIWETPLPFGIDSVAHSVVLHGDVQLGNIRQSGAASG
jgi:hypothetical protein